jgi:hypothetical protein
MQKIIEKVFVRNLCNILRVGPILIDWSKKNKPIVVSYGWPGKLEYVFTFVLVGIRVRD